MTRSEKRRVMYWAGMIALILAIVIGLTGVWWWALFDLPENLGIAFAATSILFGLIGGITFMARSEIR